MKNHTQSNILTQTEHGALDQQGVESGDEISKAIFPRVTLTILVIIVVVFVAMVRVGQGDLGHAARLFGDKEPALIHAGQWWRLITPIFLHGSWIHLLINGLSLVWFGGQIERIYGSRKYLLIYMLAGIAGNVLSYLKLPASSLGASGALFGLIGAGIVFPLRFRHLLQPQIRRAILRQLSLVAVINLGLSFADGIDRYAHFGGFFGGAFVALFLVPDVLDERPRRLLREACLTGAAVLMIGLVALAGLQQWHEAREESYPEFITYVAGKGNAAVRFQLSRRWRPCPQKGGSGSFWIDKQGATIHITDSVSDIDLFEHTEQWRAEHEVVGEPILLNGQMGSLTTVNIGGLVTQLYEFQVAGNIIEVVLVCSQAGYIEAQKDYVALLESLRLIHLQVAGYSPLSHGHNFLPPTSMAPRSMFAPDLLSPGHSAR